MKGSLLSFLNARGGHYYYNPSAPFRLDGDPRAYLAVREEPASKELESRTRFARLDREGWRLLDEPVLPLEDPAVSRVNNNLVLCGVRVTKKDPSRLEWRTDFYTMNSLESPEFLASGPPMMKDIRLVNLPEGVGVLTRPRGDHQHGAYGNGRVGYFVVSGLDELAALKGGEWYRRARILQLPLQEGWWAGANQGLAYETSEGVVIGVIGHQARWRGASRVYEAVAFTFTPGGERGSPPALLPTGYRVIARRREFLESEAKEGLAEVVFPGGIENPCEKRVVLYAGLSDRACGVLPLENPFSPLL